MLEKHLPFSFCICDNDSPVGVTSPIFTRTSRSGITDSQGFYLFSHADRRTIFGKTGIRHNSSFIGSFRKRARPAGAFGASPALQEFHNGILLVHEFK
jgi:hypothetical protein